MSSRQFRKRVGLNTLPPPSDESDCEFEPLCVKRLTKSAYAELLVSASDSDPGSQSGSDKDEGEQSVSEEDQVNEEDEISKDSDEENKLNEAKSLDPDETQDNAGSSSSGKPKKKNGKRNKNKGRKADFAHSEEMDEIDRSLKEVNAILGEPSPVVSSEPKPIDEGLAILEVDDKHLKVANELRRIFGPEEKDRTRRQRGHQPRASYLMLKRVMVLPNKETSIYDFHNSGISMQQCDEEKENKCFVFMHDSNYQKNHRSFLVKMATAQGHSILIYLDEARKNMHVEALIEISDMLFRYDENTVGNEIIENVVTYMQYVASSAFMPNDSTVRLEYKYMENRPFHVAMMKYMYLLSNKACHRTALEIAKMLLMLDPSDPLAVISVIDSFALRARENEWLIDAIKYFNKHRQAEYLHNMKYSNALAHYFVAVKKKEDLAEANKLLQDAILAYPEVYTKIIEYCYINQKDFLKHPIFSEGPKIMKTPGLEELFRIYVKMSGPRWKSPAVAEWLRTNVVQLMANYDENPTIRETAKKYSDYRVGLFQVWPAEYLRHISVLNCMSKLILDEPLDFPRVTCGWDPLFDTGVNRYNYQYRTNPPRNLGDSTNVFYRFFQSMIP